MVDINKLVKYTKDIKVLYVEDNSEAREATLELLDIFFDNIVVGVDGEDGIKKFKEHYDEDRIDLIITDINMPHLSGIDMVDKIRDVDTEVSVIIFSAYDKTIEIQNSVKLSISAYLFKPINIEQLATKLTKITNKIIKNRIDKDFREIENYM